MRWFFENISWNSDMCKKRKKSGTCFLVYVFCLFSPCPKISLHLFELVVQQSISLFFTQGLLYTSIDKDKSKVHNIFVVSILCYFFMLDYGFIVLRSSMYTPKYLEWIVMGGSITFVLNKGELHEGWWFILCHDIICILFTISTSLGIPIFWFEVEKTMLYLNLQCQEVILILNELTSRPIARHSMKCMAIKRIQIFTHSFVIFLEYHQSPKGVHQGWCMFAIHLILL